MMDMRALGESNLAFVVYVKGGHVPLPVEVHVVKNRMGRESEHKFATLKEAHAFIEGMSKKMEG